MNISCTLFEGKEGKKGKEGRTGTGNVGLIKVKDYLLPPTHSPGVDFYFYFYFRSFFLFFFFFPQQHSAVLPNTHADAYLVMIRVSFFFFSLPFSILHSSGSGLLVVVVIFVWLGVVVSRSNKTPVFKRDHSVDWSE